jgi:chromosome partitioning protein
MPTIVAANPKGGSGKSTCLLILATMLAQQGVLTCLIDADPQGTIARWAKGTSAYRNIVIVPKQTDELAEVIDSHAEKFQFVIIDVQGSANQEMAAAMSRADLVLIPMQAKTADAEVATQSITLLNRQERLFKRTIPYAVLFMRTNSAIPTREEKDIQDSIRSRDIPCLTVALHERTAYSQLFAQRKSLGELSAASVNGLPQASANAVSFTEEVIAMLRKQRNAA